MTTYNGSVVTPPALATGFRRGRWWGGSAIVPAAVPILDYVVTADGSRGSTTGTIPAGARTERVR